MYSEAGKAFFVTKTFSQRLISRGYMDVILMAEVKRGYVEESRSFALVIFGFNDDKDPTKVPLELSSMEIWAGIRPVPVAFLEGAMKTLWTRFQMLFGFCTRCDEIFSSPEEAATHDCPKS